ncbi:protein translocase subunit SecDF [Mycoplasmopsis agassizii]|uniref:protein translocase subunit SecDF n=1 Tax=Mycoplasmopsis agassizii TaxID=33922 RepID=UPI0035285539
MKKFFKKIFHWSNPRRFFTLIFSLLVSILIVTLGSVLYLKDNTRTSIDYSSGAQVTAQAYNSEGQKADNELSVSIAQNLNDRLTSGTGLAGVNISLLGNGVIEATDSRVTNNDQLTLFANTIVNKPTFIVTDTNGVPLFIDGQANTNLTKLDYQNPSEIEWNRYQVPIKASSATTQLANDGTTNIIAEFESPTAATQWTQITLTKMQDTTNKNVVFWFNLEEFVRQVNLSQNQASFASVNYNPYNFAFVNNSPTSTINNATVNNSLKQVEIDASSYLIATKEIANFENSTNLLINASMTATVAKQWAFDINASTVNYSLEKISQQFINALNGADAFNNVKYALIIAFSLVAVFMVLNYGILGVIAMLATALFLFVTMAVFTALNGEWSEASIIGLLVGSAMALSTSIMLFEKIKQQVGTGDTLKKAYKTSASNIFLSLLDYNLIAIIIAAVLFYFGFKVIRTYSLTMILSIIFTLLIAVLVTRMATRLVVDSEYFENKLHLLGIRKKTDKTTNSRFLKKIVSFNYLKNAKWFNLAIVILLIAGAIIFAAIAGVNQDAATPFNRSLDFSSGTNIVIQRDSAMNLVFDQVSANQLVSEIRALNIFDPNEIQSFATNTNGLTYAVVIRTKDLISAENLTALENLVNTNAVSNLILNSSQVTLLEAQTNLTNIAITLGIAFAVVFGYSFIRLRWTFALALILTNVVDIALLIAFFLITRLEINNYFMATVVTIFVYSVTDKITLANRVKTVIYNEFYNVKMDSLTIRNISNTSIKENFKKSLIVTFLLVIIMVVFSAFGNVIDYNAGIGIIISLGISLYTSNFTYMYIWSHFENWRQKGIRRRELNNFWSSGKVEEQVFSGFNDFNA